MPIPLVTRVLVADDHALVRKGLKLVLTAEPDLNVVAEAADGEDAVRRALQDDIDLAILASACRARQAYRQPASSGNDGPSYAS